MRRRIILLAGLLLAPALVAQGCAREPPAPSRAVFLIVVDTLRPDRLSCYGYEGHATPHIDALAERGVLFERAQSVASWTVPSMGSMLTSLYPTQLGLVELPAPPGKRFDWQELRDQTYYFMSREEQTIAEIFREGGWRTAAFVNQPGLIESGNYFQGFEDAFYPSGVKVISRSDPEDLGYPQWEPFLRHAWENDTELIAEFDTWLASNRESKIFAWIHLLTPHWPYDPPGAFMPGGEVAETEEQKREERFYNGEVRATDDLVGRIGSVIDRHVGLDTSTIVFTSDHGEAFGEHGMYDHGHSLHAEVLRIPLILSDPSMPASRRVVSDVRTIDLLPTLLDLFDLQHPTDSGFRGTSLLPLIDGEQEALPVFAEAMLYGSTERSLSSGDLKLMYDADEPELRLYDLSRDPAEVDDAAFREQRRTGEMRQALTTLYQELRDDRARRARSDSRTPAELDERTREALRSLGYLR